MPWAFDALSFLNQECGTPEGVIRLLGDVGVRRPRRGTVRKWFERGAIPGAWLPTILARLEAERGSPVSITHYAKQS